MALDLILYIQQHSVTHLFFSLFLAAIELPYIELISINAGCLFITSGTWMSKQLQHCDRCYALFGVHMKVIHKARLCSKGVTLIELLVVLAVITIFLALALPSYQYVETSDRISSEMNDLNGDVDFARISAVSAGVPVTICPSTAPSATSPSCSGTNSWQTGWIVFTDYNSNQTYSASSGDTLLRVHAALSGGDTITGEVGDPSSFSGKLTSLTINRMGATTAGVLSLHDASNTLSWRNCLIIPITGKAYADTEAQNPGVCP